MSLDPEIINEIAAELGVDPAFVEKDWYSVQALKAISMIQDDSITPIFSGGTSLSKGYELLKRFSEDLDFRAKYNFSEADKRNRPTRRAFRERVIKTVSPIGCGRPVQTNLESGSNYFKFPLGYTRQFEANSALRPELQVEFSFTQPRLEPEHKQIQSFVSLFTGTEPEATILCLSPVETGADKLSALTWRVLKRDRAHSKDDPAMIRHLHDLCALRSNINNEHALFVQTAKQSFDIDQQTEKRFTEKSFSSSMKLALSILQNDKVYEAEYMQFVDAMSYANDEDKIDFSTALRSLSELVDCFC